MKDLGFLKYSWSFRFIILEEEFVCKKKYTADLLQMAHLIDAKSTGTPLEVTVKYHLNEGNVTTRNPRPFESRVSAYLYHNDHHHKSY